MTRRLRALLLLYAIGYEPGFTADWPSSRGDPQRTGWQRRELTLTSGNVGRLRLLWKWKVEGARGLAAPTILGRMITHRGTVELVFVAGVSGDVVAIDGDFGTVFWKRRLAVAEAIAGCAPLAPPVPVLAPGAAGEEADDDAQQPLRPLHVLTVDGRLHELNPANGEAVSPAREFVQRGGMSASLNLAGGVVYTTTSVGCGGTPIGMWALDVNRAGSRIEFTASARSSAAEGVTVATDGTIHWAGKPPQTMANPVAFAWKGRDMLAGAADGRLFVADGRETRFGGATRSRRAISALATWEDRRGVRWICGSGSTRVAAFRLEARSRGPAVQRVWMSRGLVNLGPPTVAGGVVFALSKGDAKTRAVLHALDGATGRRLYSSGAVVTSFSRTGELAVANGHVCFVTADDAIYCFGFPVDR